MRSQRLIAGRWSVVLLMIGAAATQLAYAQQSDALSDVRPTLIALASTAPEAGSALEALSSDASVAIDTARMHWSIGERERAWHALARAREAQGGDHPAILIAGAGFAEDSENLVRASLLRRKALALDPADDVNRIALARDIVMGAPSLPEDAWVIAATLHEDEASLSARETYTLSLRLAKLLEQRGDAQSATAIRRVAAEIVPEEGIVEPPAVPVFTVQAQEPLAVGDAIERLVADPLDAQRLLQELLLGDQDPRALGERADAFGDTPEGIALRALVLCEAGRASRADGLLRAALRDHPDHPALLVARAGTLRLLGDYASLRALGVTHPSNTAEDNELAGLLLGAGADYRPALERLDRAIERTDRQDTRALVRRSIASARLAMLDGQTTRAARTVLSAHRAAPQDDEPLRVLIELHGPEGIAPNGELYTLASSRLLALENDPHASGMLRATSALRRGYADIAEELLLALAEARPEDPLPSSELVRLWIETERYRDAVTWLRSRLERRPGLSHLRIALARVHRSMGSVDDAVDTLEAWNDIHPGDLEVALALEEVYREGVQAERQADRLALRRLRRFPETLDRAKERTMIVTTLGDADDLEVEITRLLELAAREGDDLGPWSTGIFRLLETHAGRAIRSGQRIARVVERLHAEIPSTTLDVDEITIRILSSRHPDPEAVIEALDRSIERHPAQASLLAVGAAAALSRSAPEAVLLNARGSDPEDKERGQIRSRYVAASKLLRRGVDLAMGQASPDDPGERGIASATTLGMALRVVGEFGVADPTLAVIDENIEHILDLLIGLKNPRATLMALVAPRALENERMGQRVTDEAIGLSVHRLSAVPEGEGDHARAEALSRIGLRFAPANAMINNDLGYRLADRGVMLDEALTMTTLAVQIEPNNYSFIDSLGWVLYKQERLEDEGDMPGAVSRLDEAYRLVESALKRPRSVAVLPSAGVIGDHYADALWAAGRHDDARRVWLQAGLHTERLLQEVVGPDPDNVDTDPRLRPFFELRSSIRTKLEQAERGEAVTIASPFPPSADPEP